MQGFWEMHASRPGAPPHAGLPSRRTAGDQDHRADPKVTRIMSASTLEQPAAARRRVGGADARPAARPAGDCSAGRGHQRRLGKQAIVVVRRGATISASASRTLPELWSLLGHIDAVHGLYYLLMHGWFAIFPPTELWSRLPSCLAIGAAAAGVVVLPNSFRDAPRRCVREPCSRFCPG